MKIRNGFVSNSSSSSFAVAFPKKPKSDKDILKFMFNGEEGGVGLEYYDKGLSYVQVAKIVFDDIAMGNAKKGTENILIEAMEVRYNYNSNRGGCRVMGAEMDEDGGTWPTKRGRYYGSNRDLMNSYKKATIEQDIANEKMRDEERKIIANSGIKDVPYAYKGGKDSYTNKLYTKEQIEAYTKYEKELKDFHRSPVWVAFEKERRKVWNNVWGKLEEIRKKLAKYDVQNFLNDNKGKYIFLVRYGDEDGWQSGLMEHGNIFRNVPHIVIDGH